MLVDILTASILVLTINVIPCVHSFGHSYVIKKDWLSGALSREFSVYDKTEKVLKYRIESRFAFRHNNKIVAYPSKQVLGKLNGRWSLRGYVGDISFLDQSTNRWIDGNITEISNWRMREFMINWNGTNINLKGQVDLLPKQFYEKGRGELLAQYKIRSASRLWAARYDMDIFSIKYPESLYLLGLAVEELRSSPPKG
ncbi:unnamed protein product [Rotaria socialis]|uniref:Uncharacterized protein n=1 Tax=Rotaria socialis TaxID=392032 RepID=A0A820IGN5_9BILA|nr:unnamed protein product [Rotaria socialis]CAF3178705.1 unnamed protein product [Rotaria socialis]CAF3323807.1 unnamed protein product [Rotaria socialis]CAF3330985.1 unnamed protein product [Rotaria socialis]CAF3487148.1 unnamed protein product [Rotaria socialis]